MMTSFKGQNLGTIFLGNSRAIAIPYKLTAEPKLPQNQTGNPMSQKSLGLILLLFSVHLLLP